MPRHIVVDGSNLATEGRSMPSLRQLNDAVNAFIAENPTDVITVVVDATFGHRIDASEVPEFEAAIEHNELVAPPAGAVGRGDAFVLSIANKVKATILTNDSYQEFHPDFPWLFDEGRLIGGKPVPNVGWVFVARTPVRGPVSRRATREKKAKDSGTARAPKASKAANQPMPVPTAPPPGAVLPPAEKSGRRRRGSGGSSGDAAPAAAPAVTQAGAAAASTAAGSGAHVNSLMPFLTFVEKHPVGTSVNAIVESYSSHGAYVTIGDVRGYVPLRLMADPPPRSAREAMKIGESVTLVVASFSPARRSIDLSVPHLAAVAIAGDEADAAAPAKASAPARRRSKADPAAEPAGSASPADTAPAKKAPAKKAAAKKSAASKAASAEATTPTAEAPAKKASSSRSATAKAATPSSTDEATAVAPVSKTAAKKAPAKKAPATKAGAAEKAEPTKKTPAKAAPAEKPAPAKKAAANKAAASKATPVKRAAPAKKAVAKAAPATKAAAKARS